MRTLFICLFLAMPLFAQEIVEISVKGISNKQNDGAQQDRLEAILDAKRQACEKAGLTIESKTTVENFEVIYDFVETQAATVLLPGFQIIDIGYVQDGTYQVVLSGKIKVLEGEEEVSAKELRYAKSLRDRGKHAECEQILTKYMDSEDKSVSEELKEESFYSFIKWGYAWKVAESVQKFAAYYPDSKYLSALESFAAFSAKPLYKHDRTYQSTAADWQKTEMEHQDVHFTRQILLATDTLMFKNFQGKEQSFLLFLVLYSTDEENPQTAYQFILSYFDGNLKESSVVIEQLKGVVNRIRIFKPGGSPTFQHSISGTRVADYSIKGLMIKGQVPVGEGPFEQNVQFEISQKSF